MKKGKNASRSKGPTQRQYPVGEELRHAVVRTFERAHFRDSDLVDVSITVTEVRISPDLRNATAYVTPLGGRDMKKVVAALNRASGYFRREIAREMQLRVVPEIDFTPDTSFEYSQSIETLLADPAVARDLAKARTDAADDAGDGDASDDDSGDDSGAARGDGGRRGA